MYRRGGLLLAVNPSSGQRRYASDELRGRELVYRIGEVAVADGCLTMPGQSFVVLA